jgi:hypothetical protein
METQKVSSKHFCEKCNYGTDKKCNMEKHLHSKKHAKATTNEVSNEKVEKEYICKKCDKVYLSRHGLWCHSKTCGTKVNKEVINIDKLYELALIIINQNKEMQNQYENIKNILLKL